MRKAPLTSSTIEQTADAGRHSNGTENDADDRSANEAEEENALDETETGSHGRGRRTRGGTHDQHVTAGKKGGSRIRELIELGYKYEQEHGIGPGQNERSKLAAKRRTSKTGTGESGE